MKFRDELKEIFGDEFGKFLRCLLILIALLSFTMGFFIGCSDSTGNDCDYSKTPIKCEPRPGCKYERLIEVLNVGYVAGCELFRPRWRSK